MKKFNLNLESGKRKIIGSITFTYDKAFYRDKFDKIPKYCPNKTKINIYEGETEIGVEKDVRIRYKNARNIEIKLNKKPSKPITPNPVPKPKPNPPLRIDNLSKIEIVFKNIA